MVPAPVPDSTEYARWIQSTLNRVMGLQLPINGEMTPETRSAIRSFQARQGLPADGIVGPQTEAALIAASGQSPAPAESTPPSGELESYENPSIERVSPEWVNPGPDYVRWAQNALNQVMGLRLAIDGRVGTQTRSAVRRFQQARGLPVSGRIGPETERALTAAGADRPQITRAMPAGTNTSVNTPLPASGPGFRRYGAPNRQFGRPETIRALEAIGTAWHMAHPDGPRMTIGDISFQGGGKMPPHVSHQQGVDVDIRPLRNDGTEGPVTFTDPAYSRALTQELVNLIVNNGVLRVRYIFFNDPAVSSVRKWPGHHNHLHLRFYPPGPRP